MNNSQPFRISLVGLGTVGMEVLRLLRDNADLIAARAGRRIEVAYLCARDPSRERSMDLSGYAWTEDPAGMGGVDALVELIGGANGPAYATVQKALQNGMSVVTANKALLAHHGYELAKLAEERSVGLACEAAVAGGVPIIKAMRDGLAGNRITGVYGILNGTCNYILTRMRETGQDFNDILKDAQARGYAESDPSFDIDGVDTAHKICLLAAIAFGVKPRIEAVCVNGIRYLTGTDIGFATELGYRIKLLGVAQAHDGRLSLSVEPCLVPAHSPLGVVEDVYNGVFVEGDFVETPLFTGRGAGGAPTASSVVADLIDLARGHRIPAFGIPAGSLAEARFIDAGELMGRYYVRLNVLDRPGVLADVAAILRDHHVSIEGLLQRGRDPDQPVSVMITTHDGTRYGDVAESCRLIGNLEASVEAPCLMRIEDDL
ncbi:MAG: homoserine dehydrogenase [Alphaproteobacteria bacterium]|nr:homoserine dehydrogenase [Alphaproteobacteria bacterium]